MGKHRKPPEKVQSTDLKQKFVAQRQHSKSGKSTTNGSSKLIFEPRPDWYNAALPEIIIPAAVSQVPPDLLDIMQQHAESLLDSETALYTSSHMQKSSSHKFMSTIMSSGTWSDKVSALTLAVQESPLHTSKSFETLLGLAGKRSRDQALMALGALKDMLGQGNILPGDRKLRAFKKQPELLSVTQGLKSWKPQNPLPQGLQKAHLIYWAFEDRLKRNFFEMLRILESWCNDEVEFARTRAVNFAWELLKEKPEQEENLLRLVVNKLGDKEKKVSSRASHLLLQLQVTHPSMKEVVINAIRSDVMLRPGQSSHAKYYAIITLNQTVLQSSNPEVANKLLDVYFDIFISILNNSNKVARIQTQGSQIQASSNKRKRVMAKDATGAEKAEQELDEKITAQVLTGINRAFPYSSTDSGTFEKHLDTMFRITHSSNFNTSVQALLLIQQISSSHHISTDRFMRTLYESLLDPRLLKSSKQTMYLNLLYRSLKADVSVRRVKAFVKRLLQILHLHDPPFVTAVLFLIHELQTVFPALSSMLVQPEASPEDTEEHFHDVLDPSEQQLHNNSKHQAVVNGSASTPSPTYAIANYDARKRDPEHSNADQTCLWELITPLLLHAHPSVALFSQSLIPSYSVPRPPKPDPTTHTLSHFLDRFVYRNPKTKHLNQGSAASSAAGGVPLRGISLMQPALGTASGDILLTKSGRGDAVATPVNNEAFWARRSEMQVAPEEVFFHRYFADVGARKARSKEAKEKKEKRKSGQAEDDELDSELGVGEDEIWKALVGSGGSGLDGEGDVSDEFEDEDVNIEYDDDHENASDTAGDLDFNDGDVEGGVEDFDDDEVELNLESDDDSAILGSEDEAADGTGEGGISDEHGAKSKTETKAKDGRKRRKLKTLPMFADAADYAKMLGGDEDEDLR